MFELFSGWDDIGYNFLIGGDGRAYVGRGWTRLGAHNRGYNAQSIGVAFMGSFQEEAPADRMISGVQNLIRSGVLQVTPAILRRYCSFTPAISLKFATAWTNAILLY